MYRKIDWNTVTIRNNFLFQETLRNERLCKYFLNRVLHIQVKSIRYMDTEKTMKAQLSSKDTRLDVYVEDKKGNVADIEMQVTGSRSVLYNDLDEETVIRELPLRVRYYQNIIGTNMLRKGMHYRELKKAYVIFVCTFDPFGEGLPVYHFRYCCKEKSNLQMGDLTENIFLNTKAADKAEDEELSAFLHYVDSQKTTTRFTKELDKEAIRIRTNDDWRLRVMTLDMEIQDMKRRTAIRERKKGKEEGRRERAIEIAKDMLADGMDIDKVVKFTKLSKAEVAALT
ncbi:MAG: Rpn family recombination-promoting nuclease/putative transposase [Acidaminococcaceae bacterium]|nr:Rpn family recombination-promoting nuclease/putative transposase [Acidaminococcaceae bacterium]